MSLIYFRVFLLLNPSEVDAVAEDAIFGKSLKIKQKTSRFDGE